MPPDRGISKFITYLSNRNEEEDIDGRRKPHIQELICKKGR